MTTAVAARPKQATPPRDAVRRDKRCGTTSVVSAALRVAIYVRISDDTEGLGLGVARQEADGRALCQRQGWTVAEVFSDNDTSAYQRRKVRKGYLRMLEAIKRNEIDVVVVWNSDRLHRQLRELVTFVDLVEEHHVIVETVKAGVLDLSSANGRMMAHQQGILNQWYSDQLSEKIIRKLEENRSVGKHHGGSRPFGWNDDRVSIREDEANTVRYVTEQVLSGLSIRGIVRDVNERGWKTATGREWQHVTVRDMVLRPRNAGIMTHTPKDKRDGTNAVAEEIGQGAWDSIVSVEDFRQVQAILLNPSRVTTPGKSGKVHLLSVIAKCGVEGCGLPMVVGLGKKYKGVSKPIYRCKSMKHVSRDQYELDRFITKQIIARMEKADGRSLISAAKSRTKVARDSTRKIQELETRLTDAAEAFAQGAITLSQLTTINTSVRPTLDALRSQTEEPDRVRVLGPLVTSDDPLRVWGAWTDEKRRAAVSLLVDVTVLPMVHRSPIFNPKYIRIEWRD